MKLKIAEKNNISIVIARHDPDEVFINTTNPGAEVPISQPLYQTISAPYEDVDRAARRGGMTDPVVDIAERSEPTGPLWRTRERRYEYVPPRVENILSVNPPVPIDLVPSSYIREVAPRYSDHLIEIHLRSISDYFMQKFGRFRLTHMNRPYSSAFSELILNEINRIFREMDDEEYVNKDICPDVYTEVDEYFGGPQTRILIRFRRVENSNEDALCLSLLI